MSSSPSPAALATRLARHFSAGAVIAAASPFIAADHASAAVQYTAIGDVEMDLLNQRSAALLQRAEQQRQFAGKR